MRANWLVYFQINKNEGKHLDKTIRIMRSNLEPHVTVYIIHFGPSTKSDARLCVYTKNDERELLRFRNDGIENVPTNLKAFSDYLVKNKVKIDAVCVWAHGAGYGISKWKGWKRPFLQVNHAVDYLITPFKPSLVCFDACYQGNMSCLYEMPPDVRVVVASPAFHPFVSLMWAKIFGNLKRGITKNETMEYAKTMCKQWHKQTKATWKCMLVFDMDYIPQIAKMVKNDFDLLKFDRVSQIDKEDANLHDLFSAARHFPELQIAILKSIQGSGKMCLDECTPRVKGMSVEAHLPRKWLEAYTSTRWYKEIVAHKKGF